MGVTQIIDIELIFVVLGKHFIPLNCAAMFCLMLDYKDDHADT